MEPLSPYGRINKENSFTIFSGNYMNESKFKWAGKLNSLPMDWNIQPNVNTRYFINIDGETITDDLLDLIWGFSCDSQYFMMRFAMEGILKPHKVEFLSKYCLHPSMHHNEQLGVSCQEQC